MYGLLNLSPFPRLMPWVVAAAKKLITVDFMIFLGQLRKPPPVLDWCVWWYRRADIEQDPGYPEEGNTPMG